MRGALKARGRLPLPFKERPSTEEAGISRSDASGSAFCLAYLGENATLSCVRLRIPVVLQACIFLINTLSTGPSPKCAYMYL